IWRRLRLAAAADFAIEKIDITALILRIKLVRQISPLATGKMELYDANPTDELTAKLSELVSNSKSDALTRQLELFKAAEKALQDTVKRDRLRELIKSPRELTAGLDRELADVCVGR